MPRIERGPFPQVAHPDNPEMPLLWANQSPRPVKSRLFRWIRKYILREIRFRQARADGRAAVDSAGRPDDPEFIADRRTIAVRIGVERFGRLRPGHPQGQGKASFKILPVMLLGNALRGRREHEIVGNRIRLLMPEGALDPIAVGNHCCLHGSIGATAGPGSRSLLRTSPCGGNRPDCRPGFPDPALTHCGCWRPK